MEAEALKLDVDRIEIRTIDNEEFIVHKVKPEKDTLF